LSTGKLECRHTFARKARCSQMQDRAPLFIYRLILHVIYSVGLGFARESCDFDFVVIVRLGVRE
jgi:hypothetical protein